MKKIIGILVSFVILAGLFVTAPPQVSALCTQPSCDRSEAACRQEWATYYACQDAKITPINIPVPKGALTDLGTILSAGIKLIIIAAGLIAFVYLLLGGIKWITSGGDKAGVETARNQIIQALIGLIVVLAAWGLIVLVEKATGVCLGFGAECPLVIPLFYKPS